MGVRSMARTTCTDVSAHMQQLVEDAGGVLQLQSPASASTNTLVYVERHPQHTTPAAAAQQHSWCQSVAQPSEQGPPGTTHRLLGAVAHLM